MKSEYKNKSTRNFTFSLHEARAQALKVILAASVSCAFSGHFCARAQVLTSWYGLQYDPESTATVPDPHGAAGPAGIIQTVNSEICYWSKAGNGIWSPINIPFASFFATVLQQPYPDFKDPKTIYDALTGRFIVVAIEYTSTNSDCDIAVSKSSDPRTPGANDWYYYRFDTTEIVNSAVYIADYTALGVDSNAVYATWNMISTSGNPFNCQIAILNKANLINGTANGFTPVFTHPSGIGNSYALQPATPVGAGPGPGNAAFFCETPYSIPYLVRIWAVNDPMHTHGLSSAMVTVPNNGGAIDGAPQAGTTSFFVETRSPLTQGNAFWYNGSLWFCNTAGGTSGRAMVNYYKINLNGFPSGTPTLGESGVIDGGPGVWNYQPAIGGNAQGAVCMVFSQSSASEFPSILYTFRTASDTGFRTPKLLWPSLTYAASGIPSMCEWGDFATVSADPTDGTFWISHELMNDTTSHVAWSTRWGHINP